jgi:hypothetical protein
LPQCRLGNKGKIEQKNVFGLVTEVDKLSEDVLVWMSDDSYAMEKFLRDGVHSITSNEVRTLVELRSQQITRKF